MLGFEFACHGYRWETPAGKSEDEERDWIAASVESIRRVAGTRPVGWHCRSPHTVNTRRLLIEEGGFIYDSDAYDDDLPYIIEHGDRRHVVVPYSLDTNDMRCQRPDSPFVRARDFAAYVIDAFDWLWEEGAVAPRMMSIGLHTRIIGRPGRIAGLDMVLRHMAERGGVWKLLAIAQSRRRDRPRRARQRQLNDSAVKSVQYLLSSGQMVAHLVIPKHDSLVGLDASKRRRGFLHRGVTGVGVRGGSCVRLRTSMRCARSCKGIMTSASRSI